MVHNEMFPDMHSAKCMRSICICSCAVLNDFVYTARVYLTADDFVYAARVYLTADHFVYAARVYLTADDPSNGRSTHSHVLTWNYVYM
jgi:hypothetical protein